MGRVMPFRILFVLSTILLCSQHTSGKSVLEISINDTTSDGQKFFELTLQLEKYFKNAVKSVTKSMLPNMMSFQEDVTLSRGCMQALMKYMMNLSRAKMWAVQMLDATSKVPPGILYGTFADFGSFDECLDVKVTHKNGNIDFTGKSCSIEMRPPWPPLPRRISLADIKIAKPEDTLSAQFREAYQAMHHKHLKFVVCVPSTCSLEDVRHIGGKIANMTDFGIRIPECYVKEDLKLSAVHIAVITTLGVLFILGITGTVLETRKGNSSELSTKEKILLSFSLSSNFKRLMSSSTGSTDLKCIHGIRTLGMCWIILGHSYVFMDFELLKDPINIQTWFGTLMFELVHNGWLAVEAYFLVSGILVTFSGMKLMEKTNGKLNIPLLIVRRYFRLTPPVLLLMGLVFFLPLVSSGPFWYEQAEPQIESCRKYWWTTLLYFSNWWGIDKGCIQTTWYLAADFQLHILSLLLLIVLFRYTKAAIGILVVAIIISCATIGAQTWIWDLGATVQLSTGDNDQVFETLNRIHVQTFTHLGPHCIGMALGYYIFKYRERKFRKSTVILGWSSSIVLCLSAVLGSHRFSAGHESSQSLSILYASLHRCAFTCGVAWVLLACISGYGGPVNKLLSSSVMTPISRTTFMIYLVHPLVIWTKLGSLRERHLASHYEFVYTFITNAVISVALAAPFYLLLEAPLSNLDRLATARHGGKNDNQQKESEQKNDVSLTKVKLYLPEIHPNQLSAYEKSSR